MPGKIRLKRLLLIFTIIFINNIFPQNVECIIRPIQGQQKSEFFIGDTIRFKIELINNSNEKLTGANVYLTVNPDFIQPIFHEGKPFIGTDLIKYTKKNNTHDDVWNGAQNDIPGFQLDLYKSTGPSDASGERPYVNSGGIIAYFDLKLIGIPAEDFDEPLITFDNDNFYSRSSGYFRLDSPGQNFEYSNTHIWDFEIIGASLQPEIPDTLIKPGQSLNINLDDHFYSKSYEDSEASWSHTIEKNEPSGIFNIENINNQHTLSYQTASTAKGIFEVNLEVNIEGTAYTDSQKWKVHVDHTPEFVEPLPNISFNEDQIYTLAREDLVTDIDDTGENLQIYKDTIDSNLNLIYNDNTDSITIIPKKDWHGTQNIDIYVDDGLLFEPLRTNLPISVESVNDAPEIDFYGVDSEGDTLILYQMIDDTLDLRDFTIDVDNQMNELEWTIKQLGNNAQKIQSSILGQDTITFIVVEDGFFGSIPIEISAEDSYGAMGKDTIIADVRSFPPTFTQLPYIAMHSDSIKNVDLSKYLLDLDTPLEDISIISTITKKSTGRSHDSVNVSYNQNNQILTIDVPDQYSQHNLEGILTLTARDDNENLTTAETELIIVNTSPKIFNIPPAYIYPDTTMEILNLTNFVFDIYESPGNISWQIQNSSDFNLLASATIKDTILEATSGTNIGQDTISIIATNSKGGTDTSEVVVVITPRDPSPVIFDLPNKTVFWKDSTGYVNLDEYVFDAETPDSAISWNASGFDSNFLEVIIDNSTRTASIKTTSLIGNTGITFTAVDQDGNSSSKSANIKVQKDNKPVWDLTAIRYIYMSFTEYQKELNLNLDDICSDDLTPSSELIYSSEYSSEIKNVEIDPITNNPTITLDTTVSAKEGWVLFQAKDQQGNISISDTISIVIRETIPPEWSDLPNPIRMGNDEIYELDLFRYCNDADNNDSEITFSAQVYSNQELVTEEVMVDFSTEGQAIIRIENNFFGDVKLQLIATDPDENKSTASTRLKISDKIPPEVILEYFPNPIAGHRVNFIITSDNSNIREFESAFYKNGNYIPLSFEQLDDAEDHKIWKAEYKFQESASYQLITNLKDRYYNEAVDTLHISAEIPKIAGGLVSLSNSTIAVEYPEYNYGDRQLFMLTNHIKNKSENRFLAKKAVNRKIYEFKTSVENKNITIIVHYTPNRKIGKYNSFYKIVDNKLIPVETYLQKNGRFMAFIRPNVKFLFKEAEQPAKIQKVTENDFLTYPNPFNATVNIKFMLKKENRVQMHIYNLLGQRVFTKTRQFKPGFNSFAWQGVNSNGQKLSSGIYFVVLRKNSEKIKVKKVTYFK
ncbi:MAG: T9SS type A sorting domain-containing protein [Candidatus Marinimicrobia bacterium]|nr:T9SS type A sorting domain-containing protein [Candidatus Neomarinimicrobiota bacterium]